MSIEFRSAQSEYLTSAATFTPPTSSTVCFWMYPTVLSGIKRVIGNDNLWEVRFNGTQLLNELHQGFTSLGSTIALSINTWYHIACTRDGTNSNGQIYVNGVIDNTGVGTQTGSPGTNNLSIGTRTGSTAYFDGFVEDVRVYNAVLGADEILTIYNAFGCDFIFTNILHRWVFDQRAPGNLTANVPDEANAGLTMVPTNTPNFSANDVVTTLRRR